MPRTRKLDPFRITGLRLRAAFQGRRYAVADEFVTIWYKPGCGRIFHAPRMAGIPAHSYHISSMCGRYASFLPAEFIARLFATVNPLPNLAPTWNMAPTMDAPVVRLIDGERHLDALKWGLVPYFTKDLKKARKPINARSETIAKSGMFKAAFAERRCLVPAPAYYEWRDDPDGKTPFAVARIDGDPVVFGGIWETWKSPEGEILQTFATITTDANSSLPESRTACRSSSNGRTGRCGWARPRAIPASCCALRQRTSCGFGRSTGESAKSRTMGLSCFSR